MQQPSHPYLTDTHCHLDFEHFAVDRAEVIQNAVTTGVKFILIPAVELSQAQAIQALCDAYSPIYAAFGVHPNSVINFTNQDLNTIRQLASQPKVVAIGEIGLDYYWQKVPAQQQKIAFRQQLELAEQLNLPVIIHCRDAFADVYEMVHAWVLQRKATCPPGVFHSFGGDWSQAQQVLELGFYLGITGPVTFGKSDELRRIAIRMPLERLLIETDAPYLTPAPFRGKRNEPAYVRFTAERIAYERNMELNSFLRATYHNACRLFGIETPAL
ncbi:MAG TPA: TatD family hydrolase [Anaerolineales bacterium]|nr:TatD family hydrolase [Anaerolineales bacterium]